MIKDFAEELQVIEQESLNGGIDSKVTQESDLEQEDSEISLTEDEEQLDPFYWEEIFSSRTTFL